MSAPRLTGSWIDVVHPNHRDGVYWNRRTLAYSEADWHTLVRHLRHDLQIDTLILQNVAKDGGSVYPSRVLNWQWHTPACADPIAALLNACAAEGVDLWLGVGMRQVEPGHDDRDPTTANLEWYGAVGNELSERYGAHPAFTGWYLAAELGIRAGSWQPAQLAWAAATAGLLRQRLAKPVMSSPYFESGDYRVADSRDFSAGITATGCDIISYQDGIGVATAVQIPYPPDPWRHSHLWRELSAAHAPTRVELWANCESFAFENNIWGQPLVPAPWTRLRDQIAAAAPHVARVVSYTLPGVMTSQTVCPGLGSPETETLYLAYRQHLSELE